jgi:4-hydroxy-2-oxoheptanedioate aldolase
VNREKDTFVFKQNKLKKRLSNGDSLFGVWIETGSATNVEILSPLGFDYLLIDLEHGQGDLNSLIHMLRAAQVSDTSCIVRVPWNDPIYLKRVLDAGADSLMIPMVENAEEASAAVRACRYPPGGTRGYAAPAVRASNYGHVKDYMSKANDNLLIILQIETAAAVKNATTIACVDGVDMVFLGINDMAGSIGRLEQLDHPDARKLVRDAEAALRSAGKMMGTVPSAGAGWRELFESGYRLVPVASDVALMRDAALACVDEQRGHQKTSKPKPESGY